MWNAVTPSDGMCYHKRTLPSLPDVLHMPSVVTLITPIRKGHLAILPSLAIFRASTIPDLMLLLLHQISLRQPKELVFFANKLSIHAYNILAMHYFAFLFS